MEGVVLKVQQRDYSDLRGFNYQPSYASRGFEVWEYFDAESWRREIGRGKQYFPRMNAVRFWVDTQSYYCNPPAFKDKFEEAIRIIADCECKAMPTLFNRWHTLGGDHDVGGVYVDHFWKPCNLGANPSCFDDYVRDIVSNHREDPRILMWDLCNEPQLRTLEEMEQPVKQAEYQWLSHVREVVRETCPNVPLTIGALHYGDPVKILEPLMDVICCHPYHGWDDGKMAKALDELVALANEKRKPLIANETCCGSMDHMARSQIIKSTLHLLTQRNIGFMPWILHHSRVPHANRQFCPGLHYMAFIEADGSLRPGHDVFNEF